MKRNIIYLAIAVLLAVLIYFLVINKNEGTYKTSDSGFAVKDTNNIGKIFMGDMRGDKVTLERKGDHWVVGKNIDARPEAMATLLRTLAQIDVNVPVAKSMKDNVLKGMSSENIKVEIYDLSGKKIRSYYIGKPSTSYKGNFALMEDSEIPFVVNIPGFDGIISTRYSTDLYAWKSRNIFRAEPQSISEIKVEYPLLPDSSFTITKNPDQSFSLNKPGYNPEITKYYAGLFKNVNCENFITDKYKVDSLRKTQPVCIMSITNTDGDVRSIQVYYRPVTYRTKMQFTYEGKEVNFDLDKFYGLLNDEKDLAVIQNFVFGKLFVGPRYFFRQKPSGGNVLTESMLDNLKSGN